MLEVRLLGQFEVRRDDELIDIPSRPAQSLLAYLVLTASTSHRRERLSGMLWPDSDESNARANLRHTLWRLRKSIGDQYIEADKLSVSFDDSAPYRLDADQLEGFQEDQPLDECFARLESYQGELLPGFYDDWVLTERERLESVYNHRMQQLIDRLLREKRWAAALEWAERWIARSSLPEEAYRALMQAHAALGDAAGVAMTYDRLRKGLEGELGVEPSPQTQALYEQLSEWSGSDAVGESAPPLISAVGLGDPGIEPAALPRFLRAEPDEGPREELVGREAELAKLGEILDEALDGSGRAAFIVGEAGRGKTALANEFIRRAEQVGEELIVLRGNCDVFTGGDNPFQPFREVMTMLVGDVESQWSAGSMSREQAVRVWEKSSVAAEELVRRGPILVDSIVPRRLISPKVATEAQNGQGTPLGVLGERSGTLAPHKNRILEEYTNVVVGLAAHNPLLLVLEDLHWIDPSSADLLLALSKKASTSRVLILGTYRPEEIRALSDKGQHPLRPVLTEVKRRFGDVWLDLEASDAESMRNMVDSLVDREPNHLSDLFRGKLVEITAGHPLFVLELLRDMQERGDLVQDEQGRWRQGEALNWDILPLRVEGVIEQRIERIDDELREALSIGSVQGEVFFAEVVADVMGVDRNGLTRRFTRELEQQHRLVMELGSERVGDEPVSEFRFRHILIQRYLYRRLGEGELTYLHEATAEALESLYRDEVDEVAPRLARHYSRADIPLKAVHYLGLAGRQALRVSANEEAIDLLNRALEMIERLEADGTVEAAGLSSLRAAKIVRYLGEAYYRVGDLQRSRRQLERALGYLGIDTSAGRSWLWLRLLLEAVRQLIHRLLPAGLIEGGEADRPRYRETAYIYKMLGEVYLFANDITPTVYAALRALNAAERAGTSPELVRSYADTAIAMPLMKLRRFGEMYRQRALATAADLDEDSATGYAHLATGYFLAGEGRFAEAEASFRTANAIHEERGDWNRLGIGIELLGGTLMLQGQVEQHRGLAEQLLDLSQRSGSLQHQTWALDSLALNGLYTTRGDEPDRMRELLSQSLALIERYPAPTEKMSASAMLAHALVRAGETEQGLRMADQAGEIMGQSPPASFALWECYSSTAFSYLHAWERAAGSEAVDLRRKAGWACDQLERFAKVYPIGRARAALWRGLRAYLMGEKKAARSSWRTSLSTARAMGMPVDEGLAHYELGRHDVEPREARVAHLQQAAEIFERVGASHYQAKSIAGLEGT